MDPDSSFPKPVLKVPSWFSKNSNSWLYGEWKLDSNPKVMHNLKSDPTASCGVTAEWSMALPDPTLLTDRWPISAIMLKLDQQTQENWPALGLQQELGL